MHIAVCDDNIADRIQTERLLGRESDAHINTTGNFYIDSYGNVEAIMRSPMIYDLFLIDLNDLDESKINGAELAYQLIDLGVTAPIVLCSSVIDYEAFVKGHPHKTYDNLIYLKKPLIKADLHDVLENALAIKAKEVPRLEFRDESTTLYVTEDEILYGYREGNYMHILTTDKREVSVLTSYASLKSQLSPYENLVFVSTNAFVNVKYISKKTMFHVEMPDHRRFQIASIGKAALKKTFH